MLAVLCRSYPQVKALVDDLGLIPVDSIEFRSLESSFFYRSDPFESDRLFYAHGYVSPSLMIHVLPSLKSVAAYREYVDALSDCFDMPDERDWFFTGKLFGHVS